MEIKGLVAGLGNPGNRYLGTRHNCGFSFVEALLADSGKVSRPESLGGQKFDCDLWRFTMAQTRQVWLCACPLTFMNESGKSIARLLSWFKLPPSSLVVAHDELDLPCGDLRFKFGGGAAGHNGLRSIDQCLGSSEYYRLRIGIGKPLDREAVLGWVLQRPFGDDVRLLDLATHAAVEVFQIFCVKGRQEAVAAARAAGRKIRSLACAEEK